MNLTELITSISKDCWHRLRDGEKLGVRQGEETLTNNILLTFERNGQITSPVHTIKTSRKTESKIGTDWEWWMQNKEGWLRLAIQAKRLQPKGNRYNFKHRINNSDKFQHEMLLKYCKKYNAIPLYFLYNYYENIEESHWNSPNKYVKECLGWSFTSWKTVNHAINTRNTKSFNSIHSNKYTRPVISLFDESLNYTEVSTEYMIEGNNGIHNTLPDFSTINLRENSKNHLEVYNSSRAINRIEVTDDMRYEDIFPMRVTVIKNSNQV